MMRCDGSNSCLEAIGFRLCFVTKAMWIILLAPLMLPAHAQNYQIIAYGDACCGPGGSNALHCTNQYTGRIGPAGDFTACGTTSSQHSLGSIINDWETIGLRTAVETKYGLIENWDVSMVRNMMNAFTFRSQFAADISRWNVEQASKMDWMFYNTLSFNSDISGWDVSRVTQMTDMFVYSGISLTRYVCGDAWVKAYHDTSVGKSVFTLSSFPEKPCSCNAGKALVDESCMACKHGKYQESSRFTGRNCSKACERGTFSVATHCTLNCPANTFANTSSKTCEGCPAGTSNDGTGLTNISQCLVAPTGEVFAKSNNILQFDVGINKSASVSGYYITEPQSIPVKSCSGPSHSSYPCQLAIDGCTAKYDCNGCSDCLNTWHSYTVHERPVSLIFNFSRPVHLSHFTWHCNPHWGITRAIELFKLYVSSAASNEGKWTNIQVNDQSSSAIRAIKSCELGANVFHVKSGFRDVTAVKIEIFDEEPSSINEITFFEKYYASISHAARFPYFYRWLLPFRKNLGTADFGEIQVQACNSFGCSSKSVQASDACHAPRSYLKNGVCWTCPSTVNDSTPDGCLCPENSYRNLERYTCEACPVGKSNNGRGLTHVSQCLSDRVSFFLAASENNTLDIEIPHIEGVSFFNISVKKRARYAADYFPEAVYDWTAVGIGLHFQCIGLGEGRFVGEVRTRTQGGGNLHFANSRPHTESGFSLYRTADDGSQIMLGRMDGRQYIFWGVESPEANVTISFNVTYPFSGCKSIGQQCGGAEYVDKELSPGLGCVKVELLSNAKITCDKNNSITQSFHVPGAGSYAHNHQFHMLVRACNSFGCALSAVRSHTPPCSPPRAYLKNGVCWACPEGMMSRRVNASTCSQIVTVVPNNLSAFPVTITEHRGPAVRILATIPRNRSDPHANITHAKIIIFHVKSKTSERMLKHTAEWLDYIASADRGKRVLVDRKTVSASPGTSGWSINMTLHTHHSYVGSISLRVEVTACVKHGCGEPVSTYVPLVKDISQPPTPILHHATSYGFNISLTSPVFLGAGSPINHLEAGALYELRYRLADSSQIHRLNVSAKSRQYILLQKLLGKPRLYEFQVVLHLDNRSSPASKWSEQTSTLGSMQLPSLSGIKPVVSHVSETSIALKISDADWTGTQPMYYQIEWFAAPECGNRNFESEEAMSARVNFSQPIPVPQRLQPETQYTLRVKIVAENQFGQIRMGEPSEQIKVGTITAMTIRNISKEGDDKLCVNASSPSPCRTISTALLFYQFKGFQFRVSDGHFLIKRPIRFPKKSMGLTGNGASRSILLCGSSPCINITGEEVPTNLIGFTFRKHRNLSSAEGIHAVELGWPLVLKDCTFENFSRAFVLDKIISAVQLLRVKFINNHAANAAAISIDSCAQVVISDCSFDHNVAEEKGGAIMLRSSAYSSVVNVRHSTFTSNYAESGGAIFAGRNSVLEIQRTKFINNGASKGGAVTANSASIKMQHVLIDSIRGESAVECTASIMYFERVNITNSSGRGLAGLFCILDVKTSQVNENAGGAIRLAVESEIILRDSSIFGNNAAEEDGGGILCAECASVTINSSTFKHNSALRGGAIAILKSSAIINASILNNTAEQGGGGGIFWVDVKPLLVSTQFGSNRALYGPEIASGPSDCIVQGPQILTSNNTLPLSPVVVELVDHYDNKIVDLTVIAATVIATSRSSDAPFLGTTEVAVIKSHGTATFDNLIVAGKPGMHTLSFTLNPGTLMTNVQVKVLACFRGEELRTLNTGYQCQDCSPGTANSQVGGTCDSCKAGKYAKTSGWSTCKSCLPGQFVGEDGATSCFDCGGGQYTRTNASVTCQECENGQYQDEISARSCKYCRDSMLPNKAKISCIQPLEDDGLPLLLNLKRYKIADHIISCSFEWPSNIKTTDFEVVAQASFTRSFDNIVTSHYVPLNQSIVVFTNQSTYASPVFFRVRLRPSTDFTRFGRWAATLDEYMVTSGCSNKEYLNSSNMLVDAWTCDSCPLGASCAGNIRYDGVRGKFGYWRVPGRPPHQFHRCYFPASCLGAPNDEDFGKYFNDTQQHDDSTDLARLNLPEQCHESWGYAQECVGGRCRLCATCLNEYKRTGRSRCKKCPEQAANRGFLIAGIVVVLAGAVAIIALTIYAGAGVVTVSEATKKILLNYLQVVSMAALFPMQWPQEVETFFTIQSAISSASKSLLSPDCELSWMVAAEAFYNKQIGFALLPVLIVALCSLLWCIAHCCKCSCGSSSTRTPKNFYKNRAILSCVVLLYLVYPTMVKQGLAVIACEKVGGEFWLAADLQEKCMKGRHLAFVFMICVPQVIVYVLGLPLMATLLLYKNRRHLIDEEIQMRWGLLYAGYRLEYFWFELTIVVRKIVLVVIGGVFGARLGPDMQVYMALGMVVIFIVVHLAVRPFDELTKAHQILHWLELGALLMCWGTLYSGMLFWIEDRLPSHFRVFVTICIVAGNSGFTIFLVSVYVRSFLAENKSGSLQSATSLQSILRSRSIDLSEKNEASMCSVKINNRILDIELPSTFVKNPLQKTQSSSTTKSAFNHNVNIKEQAEKQNDLTTTKRNFHKYETDEGKAYFVEVGTRTSTWTLPKDGELIEKTTR